MTFDALLGFIDWNPFEDPCARCKGGMKTRSIDENEAVVWNDLVFVTSTDNLEHAPIPREVNVDQRHDEDVSTIFDPNQPFESHEKTCNHIGKDESEYQDLQLVMEELELQLKEESKTDDDIASLELLMGPAPICPPSQTLSSRSLPSTHESSVRRQPVTLTTPSPHTPPTSNWAMVDVEPWKNGNSLTPIDEQIQEELHRNELSRYQSKPKKTALVLPSISQIYKSYSESHGEYHNNNNGTSYSDDGSSYSSSSRLLGGAKKRSLDFSLYQHRYDSSHQDEHNHSLSSSHQTSSTDTTTPTSNRCRDRIQSTATIGIRMHREPI